MVNNDDFLQLQREVAELSEWGKKVDQKLDSIDQRLDIFQQHFDTQIGRVVESLSLIIAQFGLDNKQIGSAAGWGRQDDAGVVKYYETLTGVRVEGKLPILKKETVLKCLPAEWPVDPIDDIHRLNQSNSKVLVVLDDDPTGTQTVHDIEVLTEWSVESLVEKFKKKPTCFFILTNSRSLSSEKASALIKDICRNLSNAAKSVEDVDYTVVLRGDSTLRGHFPEARTEAPK